MTAVLSTAFEEPRWRAVPFDIKPEPHDYHDLAAILPRPPPTPVSVSDTSSRPPRVPHQSVNNRNHHPGKSHMDASEAYSYPSGMYSGRHRSESTSANSPPLSPYSQQPVHAQIQISQTQTTHSKSTTTHSQHHGPDDDSTVSLTADRHDTVDQKPSSTSRERDLLTLQIPRKNSHDLPTTSNTGATPPDAQSQPPLQQPTPRSSAASTTTSLPSFASFQESAAHSTTCTHPVHDDTDEGPEMAPMSSRLSCYSCTKLKPMVRDVAVSVAELDENVQTFAQQAVTRTLDFPKDSPVRVVQWVLDRLKYAKMDLQDAARRGHPAMYYQPQHSQQSRPDSPSSNPLKRHADQWDEYSVPKRPCSNASFDPSQRQDPVDFMRQTYPSNTGYTPPPTGADPNAAFQKPVETASGRGMRPPPSPSSLHYSSAESPLASYTLSSNIHTAPTNPATSAHIADLQHQVTLKSLALQTLQSEYASLLQKLQRERVKSQTIERKTNVADQEVNELTSKNEELTEQVKLLEARVEESEKKRETERADYARDKEQWGRMLEMSGKLQNRHSEDKQKLAEEKEELLRRVAALEQGKPYHASSDPSGMGGDSSQLGRENRALKGRVESLRRALDEVVKCSRGLDEKAREMFQQNSHLENIVQRVIGDSSQPTQQAATYPTVQTSMNMNPGNTREAARGVQNQTPVTPAVQDNRIPTPASSMMQYTGFSPAMSDMGYNFGATRQTPEDLIKALGPVPVAPQTNQIQERADHWTTKDVESRRSYTPSTGRGHQGLDDQSHFRHPGQTYRNLASPAPYSGPSAPLAYSKDSMSSYGNSPASLRELNYGSPSSSTTSEEAPRSAYPGMDFRRANDEMNMPPPPRPYSSTWQISYSPSLERP